jgi:adenylate cyclase
MNHAVFADISAWLVQAGLTGMAETDIVNGFCERWVSAGLPLGRVLVFIDTLHPVHEGRMFRWGHKAEERTQLEYGRNCGAIR